MPDLLARLIEPETFEEALEQAHKTNARFAMAAAIRALHAEAAELRRQLAEAKAELKSVDHSLSGHESFDMKRDTAIESLKAQLESQIQANLKLRRQLATAKAEGAAEAYEAEAREWSSLSKCAEGLHDQSVRRSYDRRKFEACERAAAIRKQTKGK